jgi:hypothetical protein
MDRSLQEQALDFLFKPTATLLRQYSRYAEPEEVTSLAKRFDDLKLDIESAFANGDLYEAYLFRGELKDVCQDLRRQIGLFKREAVVNV